MNVSQKSQYALRALFELAKRSGQGPVRASDIATAQAIPLRFLELILHELRQRGWVESRRGVQGGYLLAVLPELLRVGDIIRAMDGPLAPVKCVAGDEKTSCPLSGRCAFIGLWRRAQKAAEEVYDTTNLQDLVDQEAAVEQYVENYCI